MIIKKEFIQINMILFYSRQEIGFEFWLNDKQMLSNVCNLKIKKHLKNYFSMRISCVKIDGIIKLQTNKCK